MSQKCRSGSGAQGLSWGWSQDVGRVCSHLKSWLRSTDPPPRWFTHMVLLLAGSRSSSPMGLSTGSLSVLATWQLASQRERSKNKKEATVPFKTYSQKLHTDTSTTFCSLEVSHQLQLALREWNQAPAPGRGEGNQRIRTHILKPPWVTRCRKREAK